MKEMINWTEIGFQSLTTLGRSIMSAVPNIAGALFLILLGWLIAALLSFIVGKALKAIGLNKLSEKMNLDRHLEKANIKVTLSQVVGKFVYWVIILLFFITASDTLGWTVVSESIGGLISYLPQLFSAIVIFLIGFYIANFVKNGLKGVMESMSIGAASIISSIAFYLILIILTLTAMDQAGIDTTILTSNVTIFIGGIVLAFAVSFGVGSRDILSNILSSFYSRRNFTEGQHIQLSDVKGTIIKIDNTSCLIQTSEGTTVIPVKRLISEKVEILN